MKVDEMSDDPFGIAFARAREAAAAGEVPVGAVVVKDGVVLGQAGNRTLTDRDPTAHAEMLAIREAAARLGSERLIGCDLYVTLEPCCMCAGAISFARLRRVYFAAPDPKGGAVEHGPRLFRRNRPATMRRRFMGGSGRARRLSCCGGFSGRATVRGSWRRPLSPRAVIARRVAHVAIQRPYVRPLDCFATLAMTADDALNDCARPIGRIQRDRPADSAAHAGADLFVVLFLVVRQKHVAMVDRPRPR